jgi:hypothetical protein
MFNKDDNLRYGFVLLLASMMSLLAISPYWHGDLKRIVLGLFMTVSIAAFLLLLAKKKWELLLGIILAIPVTYYNWSGAYQIDNPPHMLTIYLNILFYSFVVIELLRFIISKNVVDFNSIAAAISIYFILGLIWTFIYITVEIHAPGSILPGFEGSYYGKFSELMYFSYVTLTTLGYGDISPSDAIGRNWAILQAIIGQFYMAILVARLVAIYSREKI